MSEVETVGTEVKLDVADGVAEIVLDAPERRNALTPAMADELVAALEAVEADGDVGVLILRGEGAGFCAGAELSGMTDIMRDPAAPTNYRAVERIYESFMRVGELSCPSIAAVHGAAVGAGINLLLAADVRVVARDARLISGFGRIGVHPGGGHLARLVHASSHEAATALALFDQEIDGDRAVELGLAWRAVLAKDVAGVAHDLGRPAARDPELTREIRRSLRATAGHGSALWRTALQSERAPQLWSMRRVAQRDVED